MSTDIASQHELAHSSAASHSHTSRASKAKGSRQQSQTHPRRSAMPQSYDAATSDRPVFHWLLRCPFLTTEDLAVFCGVSHSTMSRRLANLGAQGLIEWVATACLVHSGARRLYHLSNLGIHLLAATLQTDAKTLAHTWDCDENRLYQQLSQLAQILRVQTAVRGLLTYAPQAFGEKGREASGTWHWVRNYRHSFSFRNHTQILKLDAAVTFHVTGMDAGGFKRQERWTQKDDWYAALLLADTPVQDWRAAARTLDTLLSFRESPERWPIYGKFPPLLILADNVRHVERWQYLVRLCADRRQLPPLRGAIAVVPQPPRLSISVDSWHLPWHGLVTGIPCHLTQIIPKLSHAAVPPLLDGNGSAKPLLDKKRTINVSRPRARVVVGGFNGRSLALVRQLRQSSAASELPREMLRLLSIQLGAHLTEILAMLFRAPGIQVVDLANLLGIRISAADRYLNDLDNYGLLRLHVIKGESSGNTAPQHNHLSYHPSTSVWLSIAGYRLTAAIQRLSPRTRFAQRTAFGDRRDDNESWTPTVHDLGVYHFFALLARAATEENRRLSGARAQSEEHRLHWWEVGALAERRYRHQGRWYSLRPDGAGCYQVGPKRFRFWLEWDQGSMGLSDLTHKFAAYYRYLASGDWGEADDRVIPHLLIAVQSFGQLQRMRRAAEKACILASPSSGESSVTKRLNASIALVDELEIAGPVAPIWRSLLSLDESHGMSKDLSWHGIYRRSYGDSQSSHFSTL